MATNELDRNDAAAAAMEDFYSRVNVSRSDIPDNFSLDDYNQLRRDLNELALYQENGLIDKYPPRDIQDENGNTISGADRLNNMYESLATRYVTAENQYNNEFGNGTQLDKNSPEMTGTAMVTANSLKAGYDMTKSISGDNSPKLAAELSDKSNDMFDKQIEHHTVLIMDADRDHRSSPEIDTSRGIMNSFMQGFYNQIDIRRHEVPKQFEPADYIQLARDMREFGKYQDMGLFNQFPPGVNSKDYEAAGSVRKLSDLSLGGELLSGRNRLDRIYDSLAVRYVTADYQYRDSQGLLTGDEVMPETAIQSTANILSGREDGYGRYASGAELANECSNNMQSAFEAQLTGTDMSSENAKIQAFYDRVDIDMAKLPDKFSPEDYSRLSDDLHELAEYQGKGLLHKYPPNQAGNDGNRLDKIYESLAARHNMAFAQNQVCLQGGTMSETSRSVLKDSSIKLQADTLKNGIENSMWDNGSSYTNACADDIGKMYDKQMSMTEEQRNDFNNIYKGHKETVEMYDAMQDFYDELETKSMPSGRFELKDYQDITSDLGRFDECRKKGYLSCYPPASKTFDGELLSSNERFGNICDNLAGRYVEANKQYVANVNPNTYVSPTSERIREVSEALKHESGRADTTNYADNMRKMYQDMTADQTFTGMKTPALEANKESLPRNVLKPLQPLQPMGAPNLSPLQPINIQLQPMNPSLQPMEIPAVKPASRLPKHSYTDYTSSAPEPHGPRIRGSESTMGRGHEFDSVLQGADSPSNDVQYD